MPSPSLATDARPPTDKPCRLVMLAGAIKWWWLSECKYCGAVGDTWLGFDNENCNVLGDADDPHPHILRHFFGSAEHQEYVRWRNDVRHALIEAGHLTYAPHEAFKGTWTESAQRVNDMAIVASDVMLVLSPSWAKTEGTDAEVAYANKVGTPVIYTPPRTALSGVVHAVEVGLTRLIESDTLAEQDNGK